MRFGSPDSANTVGVEGFVSGNDSDMFGLRLGD
jgi:hypothetical protein